MEKRRIEVLDTTLRDGAQGEGVVFSLEDKLRVIRILDELGVDYIEAGNPASNPKDEQLFAYLAQKARLKRAVITAFGSTCHPGMTAEESPECRKLAECGAKTVSIFGKASKMHVEKVLLTTVQENRRIIGNSVAFLAKSGIQVLFDAEHFFDGYRDDPIYALSVLRAARDAGAHRLILCDTNGGTMPEELAAAVRAVVEQFGDCVGIHCHNDAGLAVAGALAAVRAGAVQVQGTMNGYGERCGNANLCTLLPNLMLKCGYSCLSEGGLTNLAPVARTIADIANLPMDEKSPYVGRSAFAHKGGMHIDAMLKDSHSFEHISPEQLGAERRYLVSEVAGRGALMTRLGAIDPQLTKNSPQTMKILSQLKEMEADGYSFEGAEASLHLRLLDMLDRRRHFFQMQDFHVISRRPDDEKSAQAYVKVCVDGQTEITADEGDGPVNAIDLAVRKALSRFYPCLGNMRLKDFKVRVVNSKGTASRVRVAVESTDGTHVWNTVGVSSNIIEASVIALTDSVEFMLLGELEGW